MRNLYVISINHQRNDAETRIKMNLSSYGWKQLNAYLTYTLNVEGLVLLRTCNRLELYYEADRNVNVEIIEKWISLISEKSDISDDQFETYSGYQDCIRHLLQLGAGFKSAIFGDDQILSQVKRAFEEARANDSMSTLLERAFQSIMRFHKQICRETDFISHTVSLAYQALKSAKFRFGTENLRSKNILIIGAGDMAAQVIKYLPKFKFASISITNRTVSKAEKLVENSTIEVVPSVSLDFLKYDMVISCTDHGYNQISDWSTIDYYIDLSLHSSKLENIPSSHILLNQLQEMINAQNELRLKSTDKVHLILEEKAEAYVKWCKGWLERSRFVNI